MEKIEALNIDLLHFFSMVNSKEDSELYCKEIDHIISELYKPGGNLEDILSHKIGAEKKERILALLNESQVETTNTVKVQEKLELIKELLKIIPVLSMTLPFEPTEHIIQNLSLWFYRNLKQKVLLDISLDRSLLGGAYLSIEGVYFDGSLRTKVEHVLNTKNYL